jgi:Cu/Zn superoxide dismutase
MYFSTVALATFAVAASAQYIQARDATDAPITYGNSASMMWQATLMSDKVQHAEFNFTGSSNGTGVSVSACFHGISASEPGPYAYHIHVKPVPADLNCTAAGGHLNPYNTTAIPCDSTQPQTCEVGDLSGKHSKVPVGEMYCTSYVDNYLSVVESNPAYIGGRSVVIHNSNNTRIACGNITMSMNPPTPTGNYTTVPVPTPTGGAVKLGASGLLMAMGIFVGALLL